MRWSCLAVLFLLACKPKIEVDAPTPAPTGPPSIALDESGVSLDKKKVAPPPAAAATFQKIEPLFQGLKEQREAWKGANTTPFPGAANVSIASGATCSAGLSLLMTTVFAGYPRVSLTGGGAPQDVQLHIPKPPGDEGDEAKQEARIYVSPLADGNVEVRGDRCLAPYDVVPVSGVAQAAKDCCGIDARATVVSVGCDAGTRFGDVLAVFTEIRKAQPKVTLTGYVACPDGWGAGGPWGREDDAWGLILPSTAPSAPAATPPAGQAPSKPQIREGAVTVVGPLAKDAVKQGFRGALDAVEGCYQAGLRTNPNLIGQVSVGFVIGTKGGIAALKNSGSDLPDMGVIACILRSFVKAKFPAAATTTQVNVPLLFAPGP
jgi:hypothetical protein